MTLEEAIIHAEKMAEKKEIESNNWTYGASQINDDESRRKQYLKHAEMWHECAEEHRQLAEWLKELEKDREILTRLDAMIDCYENCESCQGFREYPTSQFVKDVIRINKEVNADERKTEGKEAKKRT